MYMLPHTYEEVTIGKRKKILRLLHCPFMPCKHLWTGWHCLVLVDVGTSGQVSGSKRLGSPKKVDWKAPYNMGRHPWMKKGIGGRGLSPSIVIIWIIYLDSSSIKLKKHKIQWDKTLKSIEGKILVIDKSRKILMLKKIADQNKL